ncbi:MAG: hypothetical protein AAGI34_13175 [Pseudomonadota bacterium]
MAVLGQMCLIAVEEHRPPDLVALRRALARVVPAAPLAIERRVLDVERTGLVVTLDNVALVVHGAPQRIPEAVYSAAVAGNLFWPAAADAMARHTATFALGGIEAPASPGEARAQSGALTWLAAGLSLTVGGLGVHWEGTGAMTDPERLARAPSEIEIGAWPVDIWLGYETFAEEGRAGAQLRLGARTRGARPYLGCELELAPAPVAELIEPVRTLFDAARALVALGAAVEDGQVFETRSEPRRVWQVRFGRAGGQQAVGMLIDAEAG